MSENNWPRGQYTGPGGGFIQGRAVEKRQVSLVVRLPILGVPTCPS